MKKVINYLGLRKVAVNLQLDKLPRNVDQFVAEIACELQEELRQIDQALVVLSKIEGQKNGVCKNLDTNYNCKNMCLTHCIEGNKFWK